MDNVHPATGPVSMCSKLCLSVPYSETNSQTYSEVIIQDDDSQYVAYGCWTLFKSYVPLLSQSERFLLRLLATVEYYCFGLCL